MRTLRSLAFCVLLSTAALSAGCASRAPSDDDASSSDSAMVGGSEDLRWSAAGYLVRSPDTKTVACGATLIAPRVVVTAAHCVLPAKDAPSTTAPPALAFGVGNVGGAVVPVIERRVHPAFSSDDDLRQHDVAYLILERAVTAAKPATLPTSRETDGRRLMAIGYHTEQGVTVRKTARSIITQTLDLDLGSDPIFEVGFGFRQGGLCTADGDEGSAAMIPNASGGDSPQLLAGIYVGSVTSGFTDCKLADGIHDQLLDGYESAYGYREFLGQGIARAASMK